jgi:hypothetical protein
MPPIPLLGRSLLYRDGSVCLNSLLVLNKRVTAIFMLSAN